MRATLTFASAIVLVCLAAGAEPAQAACKRFGFTVNDYGKEGPIKDAKALLDKHIAKWTSDQGISDYQTGKKDVSCELFLNFIVFDEHTCTASANVCWGGDQAQAGGGLEEAEAPPPPPVRKHAAHDGAEETPKAAEMIAPAATDEPAATDGGPAAPTEKAAAETPASAADTLADTMASTGAEDKPAEPAQTAPKPAEEEPPAAGVVVETGTLADNGASAPAGKPTPDSPVKTLATYPDKDQAAAAAAAATAAAAAERAAAAAESAAAAAKEAAAAAVAASAASRGSIVPPLDPMPGADKAARAGAMGAH
jgi:hypothetical protein